MFRRLCSGSSCLFLALLAAMACTHAPARPTTSEAARPAAPASRPAPAGRAAATVAPPARMAEKPAVVPRPAAPRAEAPPAPPRVTPPAPVSDAPPALQGVAAPVWHVGDQWAFRWESGEGQGEYVWTVDRTEVVDGVEQYVIRSGPREIHYRARDLATSLETLDGAVEVRHIPPRTGFSWPLTPGTMWRETYTEERGPDRVPLERAIAWQIEAKERIRVEAGSFDTLKIVAYHDRSESPAVMYEMWYAPAAKQFVRLEEHFPTGIRYRELIDFSLS